MVISTPKSATWVSFAKTRESFKHLFSAVRFQHNFSSLNRVSFWDVNQKVDMVQGEAKVTELKTKTFEFMECLDTGVNIDLFSKAVVPVVGDKHHGHPVISGVTHNLFRATTTYNIHN